MTDSKDKSDATERLPFEPKKSKKKPEKQATGSQAQQPDSGKRRSKRSTPVAESRIPEVVSKRMVMRIALFCGIPTALGLATFFISYWLVTQKIYEVPNYLVVVLSLGLFGLGTLGLSYGVLSASWDEDIPGSWLGIQELRINLKRFIDSWKLDRESAQLEGDD